MNVKLPSIIQDNKSYIRKSNLFTGIHTSRNLENNDNLQLGRIREECVSVNGFLAIESAHFNWQNQY